MMSAEKTLYLKLIKKLMAALPRYLCSLDYQYRECGCIGCVNDRLIKEVEEALSIPWTDQTIILSEKEFKKFEELTNSPPAPSEALIKAMNSAKRCIACFGTKKILEDHDGRAGYRECTECK